MHRNISINTLCLEPAAFDRHLETVARLGARGISPTIEDIDGVGADAAARLVRASGLSVATLTHRAFGFTTAAAVRTARVRLERTIEVAATIGAGSVTLTTGGRGDLDWSQSVACFADAIAPCADLARRHGVRLAIEPTSHLYADVSIAHRLADTATIARRAGIALGIDLFACWFDSDIAQALGDAAPLAALVQVSDHVSGDRGLPCRAVPGDGMIPLDRLLPALVVAGFTGPFDLEIIGPRIAGPHRETELKRAATHVGTILEAAGLRAQ